MWCWPKSQQEGREFKASLGFLGSSWPAFDILRPYSSKFICLFFQLVMCLFACVCLYVTVTVWRSEGNLQQAESLLPCGSWGLNLGCQTWQAVWPAELSDHFPTYQISQKGILDWQKKKKTKIPYNNCYVNNNNGGLFYEAWGLRDLHLLSTN